MISKENPLTAEYHRDGKTFQFKYWEVNSFDDLELEKIKQIYGVCLCSGKMVVVLNGKAGTWGLVGGTREQGESVEETLIREIREESNTKVLAWKPVGVQQVTDPDGNVYYQLRAMCLVESLGDFEVDPAGTIIELKMIDPKEYKNYFDWGEIGENIIQRALLLLG